MRKNSLVMIGVDLHTTDQLLRRHCTVTVRNVGSAVFERRVYCDTNCSLCTAMQTAACVLRCKLQLVYCGANCSLCTEVQTAACVLRGLTSLFDIQRTAARLYC